MKHSITKKIPMFAVTSLWLALTVSHTTFGAQEPKTKALDSALTHITGATQESKITEPAAALASSMFTYQGQLKDASGPVNGSFDFQFVLYSAPAGGEALGTSEIKDTVLTNGMFSFKLDFGHAAVQAKEGWLEIGVRPSGSTEAYTVLFPRQKLTPTPYAIFAQHEQWSLIGVPVGFVDRAVQEGVNATIEADGITKPKDDGSATEATVAAAPQGTPDFIAKFDGAGNPTANSIMFDNGVNVGIGTINPTSKVEIAAQDGLAISGYQPFLTLRDTNAANARSIIQGVDGHIGFVPQSFIGSPFTAMIIRSGSGNVGIGTANPTSRLEIAAQDGLAITGFQPFLTLRDANAGGKRSFIQGVNGDLVLLTNSRAALVVRDGDGLVSVRVLQILGGSDLSENFDVSSSETLSGDASPAEVQPGMVVAIDPENPGKLVVSHQAYDRRVAGIVSGAGGIKPGVLMSQSSSLAEGSHPIALTGRVYCWADASYGSPDQPV
ncbi:MAG: hypothetical protein HY314_06370 [Acidobacteria bacterium]|nr:hypothetical protein [Acidobacteriota bacterium]